MSGLFRMMLRHGDDLGSIATSYREHARRTMRLVVRQINPKTRIAPSFTADARLKNWAVVYDNAVRAMAHLCSGQIARAQDTIDYFIENHGVRKTGFLEKDGRILESAGWIVNIIDASHPGRNGKAVENIAHVGPNAYLGLAALHLYAETRASRYLRFARDRWELIQTLQNEVPEDFNYGGVRMGPLGGPGDSDQNLDEDAENPSFYDFYNGEHAADFRGLSLLLAYYDPENRKRYEHAAYLIMLWDRKIWNSKDHLFYIGTAEKKYFDANIGSWVEPGVIPMHPLDTNALKISAYGLEGMEAFGAGTAKHLRQAIDDHFLVKIGIGDKKVSGYDFVSHEDRERLIFYEERGPDDEKVKVGIGRKPMLSDEWSTWVAFADLRMASDYLKNGDAVMAARHLEAYRINALDNALDTATETPEGDVAYPYAHPLPYSLNKPVGFGWNTHHQPYALIGACARVLGLLRFDPFLPNGGAFSTRVRI